MGFTFDPTKTQEENIACFIDYLKQKDSELSCIIEDNLSHMYNFAEKTQTEKTRIRQLISKQAISKVEALKQKEGV